MVVDRVVRVEAALMLAPQLQCCWCKPWATIGLRRERSIRASSVLLLACHSVVAIEFRLVAWSGAVGLVGVAGRATASATAALASQHVVWVLPCPPRNSPVVGQDRLRLPGNGFVEGVDLLRSSPSAL